MDRLMDQHARGAERDEVPLDLEQLKRRCMGRIELVERLLMSFEDRFPVELAQIEESLGASDVSRFVRLAHQLKGAAANISAPGLRVTLEQLEDTGRAGQMDEVGPCLANVRSEWSRFQSYLAASHTGGQAGCAN
jgi:HPt (histidine-containing phosphotransfer) domain-containing protein